MKYDYAVVFGNLRPVTKSHLALIDRALEISDHVVIVCGSAQQAPTPRAPFTDSQVLDMLTACLPSKHLARITPVFMADVYNDDLWLRGVRTRVREVISRHGKADHSPSIAVVANYKNEQASGYLKRLVPWSVLLVENLPAFLSTRLRDSYWEDPEAAIGQFGADLPSSVADFMLTFAQTKEYSWLREEHRAYRRNDKAFAELPYRPVFHEACAVVTMDDHVLLCEKDTRPGLGLYALPSVFVGEYETLDEAVLRALKERVKIKLPGRILRSKMSNPEQFSAPMRSERGRVFANAFRFDLDEESLPKVTPGTGTAKALWLPINEIDPTMVFEDHKRIIDVMSSRQV